MVPDINTLVGAFYEKKKIKLFSILFIVVFEISISSPFSNVKSE